MILRISSTLQQPLTQSQALGSSRTATCRTGARRERGATTSVDGGSGQRAGAGSAVAAGAAGGVARGGPLQVDAGDVGDADQPGEGVAQLVLKRGGVGGAQGLGDFADLLDPPAEGAVHAPGAVARPQRRL